MRLILTFSTIIAICTIDIVAAIKVRSCPRLDCDYQQVASDVDGDDWCMRVNYFDSIASEAVVQIRKCNGTRKTFCEWGMPHLHDKFIWPFHQETLVERRNPESYDPDTRYEAKCVDANTFYGRNHFYPGWSCLIDMDCHSKKCVAGRCAGRLEGADCNANIDCVSGLYCNRERQPGRCEMVIKSEGDKCYQDGDCIPRSCFRQEYYDPDD